MLASLPYEGMEKPSFAKIELEPEEDDEDPLDSKITQPIGSIKVKVEPEIPLGDEFYEEMGGKDNDSMLTFYLCSTIFVVRVSAIEELIKVDDISSGLA